MKQLTLASDDTIGIVGPMVVIMTINIYIRKFISILLRFDPYFVLADNLSTYNFQTQ